MGKWRGFKGHSRQEKTLAQSCGNGTDIECQGKKRPAELGKAALLGSSESEAEKSGAVGIWEA